MIREKDGNQLLKGRSWLLAVTRVSVALVRVHWQVGEIRAGALVKRSGHDEMHQAFGFADGVNSLAVGHPRHQLFIHLREKDERLSFVSKGKTFTKCIPLKAELNKSHSLSGAGLRLEAGHRPRRLLQV